ncbi:maleylacetoacetate isomerase [Ruegeria profundi]|uniref:maleylacetoacetate isomerase n=1 Tax=Ruegeria profundi TaxID=1685378 RepID=UPI001CD81786|nr:maleylacetoacetate isomerase [Ruegeria profundi]MCA0928131.1 maleylacetoacetate isomerase [Ruegeria profundi]
MIKLYDYWRSSASYRVRIALGLAGENWETVIVDLLNAEQRSEAHLARNPQGLVPVLEIDGHSFTQSLAQIEYIDETRGLGLLPSNPASRAEVRALSYAVAMEIHPVCNLRVAKWAVEQSEKQITMEGWMQHFIGEGLMAYEAMLQGGRFSYGDRVTLADVCLMPQLYNAQRWGVDLAGLPKIARIKDSLEQIPAFQDAHPDNSPH